MPRVHTKTKTTRGKRTYTCSAYPCKMAEQRDDDRTIRPGDRYYTWSKRFGGDYFRHVDCGYPKPSQLSNRKTAQIEDVIGDADFGSAESVEDLQSVLGDIASTARDVAGEYEDSAGNMPENLQYGSQAEAMREVAQELESWADELEGWSPQNEEPGDDQDRDEWLDEIRDEAQSQLDEMPEYQG